MKARFVKFNIKKSNKALNGHTSKENVSQKELKDNF